MDENGTDRMKQNLRFATSVRCTRCVRSLERVGRKRGSRRTTIESSNAKDDCLGVCSISHVEALPVQKLPPVKSTASGQESSASDAKKMKVFYNIYIFTLTCLMEDAQLTPRPRRWCEVWEDNMPTVPFQTSGGWYKTVDGRVEG